MSTELAVVEATVVDLPEPLSEGKAKQLDKKIRLASIKVADNTATLLDLLEEAAVGQIHVALGYPSWTAYVKEAVTISPADVNERKALVSLMSGKGMSQRAIAAVAGVNQATVSRDLSEGDAPASTETTGVDGKTYKREKKQEPIDAEVIEESLEEKLDRIGTEAENAEEEPVEDIKPPSVSADFKEEMGYLYNTVSALSDILTDERFPKARKTIAKTHLNKLQEHIAALQKVVDELMEG